jgi:signal transduction histidine kinase
MDRNIRTLRSWGYAAIAGALVFSVYAYIFLKISEFAPVALFLIIAMLLMGLANKLSGFSLEKPVISSRETTHDITESMVASLAHEIKNPLNSMKGATEYLHENYKNKKEIREFTGIILDEINRLDRYLNEFMSFSRGIKLRLKKSDIKSLVEGILMLAKHSLHAPVKIKALKDNIPEIYIDPEQIRQVIVNLLTNSNDAVADSKNPEIEILLDYDAHHVYISVQDNGTGMEQEEISKIFTPFFTTKKTGMGIGLNVSRSIITKHGGEISVKSEKGKGSSFTIILPAGKKDTDERT